MSAQSLRPNRRDVPPGLNSPTGPLENGASVRGLTWIEEVVRSVGRWTVRIALRKGQSHSRKAPPRKDVGPSFARRELSIPIWQIKCGVFSGQLTYLWVIRVAVRLVLEIVNAAIGVGTLETADA